MSKISEKLKYADKYYNDTLLIVFHDYAGCRCCFRNLCVIPGFMLAQQCVEKLLKAWVYVNGGGRAKPKGAGSHDLVGWAKHSMNFDGGPIDFSKWWPLLQKLTDSFEGKYADAPEPERDELKSSEELCSVDELICGLLSALPARGAFFTEFALVAAGPLPPAVYWIFSNNNYFEGVLEVSKDELGNFLVMHIKNVIEKIASGVQYSLLT